MFWQWGSKTPGHPEYGLTAGVEATTGPLGQGISNAVGMALAERMLANSYNRPGFEMINHHTYVICSDGDMEEGVAAEAASLAGVHRLGKLIVLYDANRISIDGDTNLHLREDVGARFAAYGWQTLEVKDGSDRAEVAAAIKEAKFNDRQPTMISVRTVIAHGSPNKAGKASSHSAPLGAEEVELTRRQLGWEYPPFEVPDEVYQDLREHCLKKGAQAEREWNDLFDGYRARHPQLARDFEDDMSNSAIDLGTTTWEKLADELDGAAATRASSGRAMQTVTKHVPRLVGGSADLAGSNLTLIKDRAALTPENHAGRNIYFGIREHGMGAICNGMALHGGFIPYGATFLIFSDYMRPAVRLSALSELQVIWVFTHDSIGVGEDGPTHQPVAHLVALRAIPNLTVLRPADGREVAYSWRIALELNTAKPTVLALARQSTPTVVEAGGRRATYDDFKRGAYVAYEPPTEPEALIVASGTETHLAVGAAVELSDERLPTKAISMPSWDLFEAQPDEYKRTVFPPHITRRLAVEAGSSLGWDRYAGQSGAVIGVDRFGASAPGSEVLRRYGFDTANIKERLQNLGR